MDTGRKLSRENTNQRVQRFTVIILLVLLAVISSVAVRAQEQGPHEAQKEALKGKTGVFERIEKVASTILTVSSNFRQERRLSMLKEPLVSSGRFAFQKPDKLRWEVTGPEPFGFLVSGDAAKQWKGKDSPPQPFDLQDNPVLKLIGEQIFTWTKADFKAVEKQYNVSVVTEDPVLLKLIPKSSGERKYIRHILISFGARTYYVDRVEITEQGGDSTVIQFLDMTANTQLDRTLFE